MTDLLITDHVWRASPNATSTPEKIECAFMNCRRSRHEHERRVVGRPRRDV